MVVGFIVFILLCEKSKIEEYKEIIGIIKGIKQRFMNCLQSQKGINPLRNN